MLSLYLLRHVFVFISVNQRDCNLVKDPVSCVAGDFHMSTVVSARVCYKLQFVFFCHSVSTLGHLVWLVVGSFVVAMESSSPKTYTKVALASTSSLSGSLVRTLWCRRVVLSCPIDCGGRLSGGQLYKRGRNGSVVRSRRLA